MKLSLPWKDHRSYSTRNAYNPEKGRNLLASAYMFAANKYNFAVYATNISNKFPYETLDQAKAAADEILIQHGWKLLDEDKLKILL